MPRNANRGTTVSDTVRESTDVTSLMSAGQAFLIILTINGDVIHVLERQFLASLNDGGEATFRTHSIGRVVRVTACTVPLKSDQKDYRVRRINM